MSRSKRFANSVVFAYAYQALLMVTGLWLTPFLLRHLGQHDYGLWLMGLQVLSYLMLTDFGIIGLLPRSVAYATGRAGSVKAATDLPEVIGQTAVIVLWQTAVVALAAFLVWTFLPGKWAALKGPLGLMMAAFTMFFPVRIFPAVLEGLQEQAFVTRATMVAWGVSTAVNVMSVLAGLGLYSLAIGSILSQACTSAACLYRLRKHFPGTLPSRLPSVGVRQAIPQLGRGFWVSSGQIGTSLLYGSDILILGKVMGPTLLVPYSCTAKLAGVLSNQPQLLMQAAVPGLSELKAGSTKQRLHQVTVSLTQGMMLISGLLFCVVLVVNKGFVDWWVGAERYAGFALTCLILTQVIVRHFNLTFLYSVFCFGYERRLALTVLADGIVTASSIWFLSSRFGYLGAAAGSLVGAFLVGIPMNLVVLVKELDVPLSRLLSPLLPWFWRFVLTAGCCFGIVKIWSPHGVIQIALAGLLVSALYIGILARATMATPLGHLLRDLAMQFIGRFRKPKADLVMDEHRA
ncbi:MAG TPA: oligosaccharide flippase family protein [Bryobacteraceae bacterium]|nr:oligosaccharide flippase family protein [Bryobacteraceae bacterium]